SDPRRAMVGARRGPCLVRGRSCRFVYRPQGSGRVGGNASVFCDPRKEVRQLIWREAVAEIAFAVSLAQTANTRVFMDVHEMRNAYAGDSGVVGRQRGSLDDGSGNRTRNGQAPARGADV